MHEGSREREQEGRARHRVVFAGMRPRAVVFDFNGTLSDDESILCEIFQELFAEQARPLSSQQYFDELAGRSDPEIVRAWLGPRPSRRGRGAARAVEPLPGAGRRRAHRSGTHARGRPLRGGARPGGPGVRRGARGDRARPRRNRARSRFLGSRIRGGRGAREAGSAGYVRALELLDGGLRPQDVLVLEDTEAGVGAAKGAGKVVAVLGTLEPGGCAGADEIVGRIDTELMERLLE